MAETAVRTCRACGCTDDRACEGGCWWVADDLCSQCDEEAAAQDVLAHVSDILFDSLAEPEADCLLCRHPSAASAWERYGFDDPFPPDDEADGVTP